MHEFLPRQVHVFVRDWLSANNIVLRSDAGNTLVDTGYSRHVPLTLALLATARGLGDGPLARIVNTHGHSDHIGGNAAVARKYGCPILVPEGERALFDRWDTQALLYDYADQHADRFTPDESVLAGSTHVWGDLEWQALAAPGHDMGALVFYNAAHRILISGDALWENGFGIVMPPALDAAALPATRATVEMLATLDIGIVIPGHGEPFTAVDAAIERAIKRVASFEADPMRMARHFMKALFSFALLDRQHMRIADIPAYLGRVGVYRDFNAQFFRLSNEHFAAWLVAELERAGAVRRHGDDLVPV